MTRQRRTDDQIGWELARRNGVTTDREYEAFKRTLAYQAAIFNERLGDLGWALLDAWRIPQLVAWISRRVERCR